MRYRLPLAIMGVGIVLLIIFLILSSPATRKKIQDDHNSQIDFSCVKDSDCSIKYTGCDMCYGRKRGCTNIKSIEGWCLRINKGMTCMASSVPPTSCSCINNICESNYDY